MHLLTYHSHRHSLHTHAHSHVLHAHSLGSSAHAHRHTHGHTCKCKADISPLQLLYFLAYYCPFYYTILYCINCCIEFRIILNSIRNQYQVKSNSLTVQLKRKKAQKVILTASTHLPYRLPCLPHYPCLPYLPSSFACPSFVRLHLPKNSKRQYLFYLLTVFAALKTLSI